MNAPAKAEVAAVAALADLIPLTSITPSETHIQEMRRARFSKDALAQLADSIKTVGVLQPVVVRPLSALRGLAKYELVAGERRWIAAKAAGLAHIPASVRPLSDEEVLEVQLIENLQREGLHELEEAEGYEQLMKLKKITADQVGEMVGKSRSYVYARTKLLALCPEARKSFYAGDLDASRALLIARIGHHDTQRQAVKDLLEGRGYGVKEPMSYREAHKHILENYMLALKSAPFDTNDAALLSKAGSCAPCPKRTGNQRDLFGDVKSADVCTDPKCFDDKRQAHFAAPRKALEAKGSKVIYGEPAKKIFDDWESPNAWARDRMRTSEYVKLSDLTYATGGSRKVSDVLGEEYEPILIQHPATGAIIKVATQQAISRAVASKKKNGKGKVKAGGGYNYSAQEKKRTLERQVEEQTRAEIFTQLHAKVGEAGKEELVQVVRWLAAGSCDLTTIGKLWGWKVGGYDNRAFMKNAEKLAPAKLGKLLFELAISGEIEDNYDDKVLADHAKRLKIDTDAIANQVKAKLMPAPKAEEKKKPAAKAKASAPAKTKKKAAKAKGKKK
jgi:ParB/RepB/Spo0J family partition protein